MMQKTTGIGKKLWLYFVLDQASIVPGQAISFSINLTPTTQLNLGAVTATVFLVNDQGTPIGPLWWSGPLPKSDIAALQPKQTYTLTPGLIPCPAALQSLAYTQGKHNFSCVLSGTGTDGGPYQAFDWLWVVLESIDSQAWWQWTNPSLAVYASYPWKNQDYTVNGLLQNRFADLPFKIPTVLKSGTLSVVEEEISDQGAWTVIATREFSTMPGTLGNLGQGADMEVLYSVKAKTWPWHQAGTYVVNDDLERLYVYSIHLTNAADQYNNQYPDQSFVGINVHVAVDQGKIAAAVVAFSAFGVWLAASAAAGQADLVGKIVFAAIATLAAITLGIAGKIADDPPGPDPRYRQAVHLAPLPLPPLLSADPELRPIGQFFEVATRIVASVDALNTVANRLSIARRQHNTRATKLHIATLRKMLAQMTRDWHELDKVLTPALAALGGMQSSRERKPIDPQVLQRVLQYELPQEARDALAAASGAPLTVAAFVDPKDALRQLAVAVGQLVVTVRQGTSKTLVTHKSQPKR